MAALGWLLNLGFAGTAVTEEVTGYVYRTSTATAPTLSLGVPASLPTYISTVPTASPTFTYNQAGIFTDLSLIIPRVNPVAYDTVPYILVAASDAPQDVRNQTPDEYVCDGTDDDVQIELAIATGSPVMLSSGNFYCSQEIDLNSADEWVIGSGYSTIVNVATGTATDQDTFQITGDRCGVGNLRVVGGAGIGRNAFKVGAGAADVQLFNLWISNPNQHGIGATGESGSLVERLSIRNVYVEGAGAGSGAGQGVVLSEYTADCLVDGLWATGGQESGLHTFDNSGGTHATRHQFSNIYTWSNGSHGISIQDVDRTTLTNFVTHSNTTHGLRFNTATSAIASNGVSYGNTEDGVDTDTNSSQLALSNIVCDGNGDNGFDISAPSTSIVNCQAINQSGTGDRGFSFAGTADNSQMLNCIADGNYDNIFINGSAAGIQIIGGALTNASNNNVTDNAGSLIKNVSGYVTENSGTGSITFGGTTDVITHGLDVTPTIDDIIITLGEDPTNTPGAIWVDTIGSSQFTVNCENDPGASNLDFGWRVVL